MSWLNRIRTSLCGGEEVLRWSDHSIVIYHQMKFESLRSLGEGEDLTSDYYFNYLSALVHSNEPKDVQNGIQKLNDFPDRSSGPDWLRFEIEYRLAVGYYRKEQYEKSLSSVDKCLQIHHDHENALKLKKLVGCRLKKNGVSLPVIAVVGVGVCVICVCLAAVARKTQ